MNFGVKKFSGENIQKKNNLIFECYNLMDPMDFRAIIFSRLMYIEVT
jgi:hypothetical protein